ncbi:MAG: EAL domain-containing protein [Aeromonadales bacterium]|nr:EAL domain-containing protein [Aeromonadales bacterium]
MEYGIQIACLTITAFITVEFYQYRRLKLLSTKLFEGFLYLTLFSVFSEVASIYVARNPQFFSIEFSKTVNQLRLSSFLIIAYYVYIYIDLKCKNNRQYKLWQFALRTVPLAIGIVGLLVGSISYHVDARGVYSYGSQIDVALGICLIYFFLAMMSLAKAYLKNRNSIKIKLDFLFCFTIISGIALYQYIQHTVSFFCLSLVVFLSYIFFNYENSKENEDKEIPRILSRLAFETTLREVFYEQKQFWIISFYLQNIETLRATYTQATCIDCIDKSIKSIPDFKNRNIFRISEYSFGFFIFNKDELDDWYARYKVSDKALTIEDSTIEPSYFVCSIECPTIAKDVESFFNLLSFCQTQFEAQTDHSMFILDKATAEKRDYYVSVEKLVQKAIDNDGFFVVYQPIINSKTGLCESAEALVRLKDTRSFGFISPEIFIRVAERKGLISKLGDQVFFKVCRFAREYHLKDIGIKYIEVNLSGIQISDPSISYRLHQCAKSFGIEPDFINLEVTETEAVRSNKIAVDNVNKLKKLGYKFSLDDFGTGYSNFSKIATIDFDLIKLDKSLIWPAFADGNTQKAKLTLQGCINMIKTLGFTMVAEGVETQEQAEYLRDAGVEFLQGYYYSKPISSSAFLEFVQRFNIGHIDSEMSS